MTREQKPAPLIEIKALTRRFLSGELMGRKQVVTAADRVSFSIEKGRAAALVGESGSGKSTIARMILRLEKPDSGRILLDGEDVLTSEPGRASLAYRKRVQMIFQDPFGSLNPIHTVSHHIIRPMLRHRLSSAGESRRRAIELLETVGLEPAGDFIDARPFELSGGQRQRVAIARTLAVDPDLLVADEPTSMLDVSIRMGILNLLADLKVTRPLAILLITHDLASARYLADTILVLLKGRIVEAGPAGMIVEEPLHPYTRALISAAADEDSAKSGKTHRGISPGVENSSGCPFFVRCAEAMDMCRVMDPDPVDEGGRSVRCHLYDKSDISGRSEAI